MLVRPRHLLAAGGEDRAFAEAIERDLGKGLESLLEPRLYRFVRWRRNPALDLALRHPQPLRETPVDLGLGPDLARGLDELVFDLNVGVPVGVDDIGLLEHRFRRQYDVGLARGVGQKLVDHHPEVEGAEGFEHLRGVRILGDRVAALDPSDLQRGIPLRQHLGSEPGGRHRDPDRIVIGLGRIEGQRILVRAEDMALEVGIDPTGARFAEVAGEGEEGDQRAHGLRRVGVALHPEAGANTQRSDRSDELDQPVDDLDRDVGDLGDAVRGVLRSHGRVLVEAVNVVANEDIVEGRPRDQEVGDAESEGAVGPGADLDQQLRAFGRLRAPRIDDHHPRPALDRLLDESHLVDVGLGRVLAPEDDQPRVDEVPRRVVAVVAQGQPSRLEPRRPAQIAIGRGAAAEEAPEPRRYLVHQPLGGAGGVEEDAACAVILTGRGQLRRDSVECGLPGDPLEASGEGALQGVEQSVLRIHPFDVGQPLEARSLGGGQVAGVGLDRAQPAVLDRNPHSAGAETVSRTGSGENLAHRQSIGEERWNVKRLNVPPTFARRFEPREGKGGKRSTFKRLTARSSGFAFSFAVTGPPKGLSPRSAHRGAGWGSRPGYRVGGL